MLNPDLEQYINEHTSPEYPFLKEVAKNTLANFTMPNMLSGHYQGVVLELLSRSTAPKNILEIGTYTGYSAICLAQGLVAGGQLHTIEKDESKKDAILQHFLLANVSDKITLHIGNALDIVPKFTQKWDIVFIDADKVNNINYFQLVSKQLSNKGIIIVDNVLWHGKVLENKQDKKTQAIKAFNDYVVAQQDFRTTILPVRDGLMLIKKI